MKIECKQGRRQQWHFRLRRESDNKLCAVSPMSGHRAGFASAEDADKAANEVLEARAIPLREALKTLQESVTGMRLAQDNRIKEMQGIIDYHRKRTKHGVFYGTCLGLVVGALAVHFG